jgi:hypothetical protein
MPIITSNGCRYRHLSDTILIPEHPRRSIKPKRRLCGKNKSNKRTLRRKFNNDKILLSTNIVVNHSSTVLNIHEISVLNKGLGFVPSHYKPNFQTINDDLLRFERKLQLHYHFNKDLDPDCKIMEPIVKKPLEGNSEWWPRILNPHITKMCHNLKEFIFSSSKNFHTANNLSKFEINALNTLKMNKSIIIKKADKGGGIVVLDNNKYLNQINTLLLDAKTYLPVLQDDTLQVKRSVDGLLHDLQVSNIIGQKQFHFLTNFIPRCPRFYGLPKLHKDGFPLRPIVSQIDGPTSRLNLLVDKLLHTAESNIPFLLQDTTAFLNLINTHSVCTPETYLVTLDVTSLYTNIPHTEGCAFVCEFYEKTLHLWDSDGLIPPDVKTLHTLMMFILENCTFEFNNTLYKQLFGTTMGASFSVKFANIYMHVWLTKYIGLFTGIKPEFLARLIDDIFFFWNSSEVLLLEFINFLNDCHPSIKFEATYSKDKIHFLDTEVYIQDNTVRTTIFTKPTDKKQYLHFSSYHPAHVTKAIPYSQALRYRRNIEDDSILKTELKNLMKFFTNRGYPSTLLNTTVQKILLIDRSSVLKYKDAATKKLDFEKYLKGKSFLPLIIQYSYAFQNSTLLKHLHTVWSELTHSNISLKNVFDCEFPQIVFKRGFTIGNLLVSSKFKEYFDSQDLENIANLLFLDVEKTPISFRVTPCDSLRCGCCKHIQPTSSFSNSTKTNTHIITSDFNCSSSNLLYLISCKKCEMLYVGQTTRTLRERLNNHRSNIKLLLQTSISIHFNLPTHSISDLIITPFLDILPLSEVDRNKIEFAYMKLLNTLYPKGLNNYPLVK